MKFYRAENAGRQIGGVFFAVYDIIAGTALGIYAARDDAPETSALDALAGDPRSGVTAISETDYANYLKKKRITSGSEISISLMPQPGPLPAHPLKGSGAVVVEQPKGPAEESQPVEIKQVLDTVEDALRVEQIKPPQPTAPSVEIPTPRKATKPKGRKS